MANLSFLTPSLAISGSRRCIWVIALRRHCTSTSDDVPVMITHWHMHSMRLGLDYYLNSIHPTGFNISFCLIIGNHGTLFHCFDWYYNFDMNSNISVIHIYFLLALRKYTVFRELLLSVCNEECCINSTFLIFWLSIFLKQRQTSFLGSCFRILYYSSLKLPGICQLLGVFKNCW